jgi:coproporphyrinogen III oxidase
VLTTAPTIDEIEAGFQDIQSRFIEAIEHLDGAASFGTDRWRREGGGGGITRILERGMRIEKAAVNFSSVFGDTPAAATESGIAGAERFHATGVSIIVHPDNPHAPTFHANLRYFETTSGRWFGGGADMTPYYLHHGDARHFHGTLRSVCERHEIADHQAWKAACDQYFHLPHRGEARGIGGLFFDHLTDDLALVWDFACDLGMHFGHAYVPILERRMDTAVTDEQRRWHEIRRGRYAEFNLVWDRGTRFGLETGGRAESILASLPPRARWDYNHHPTAGSPEAELLDVLSGEPVDWLA